MGPISVARGARRRCLSRGVDTSSTGAVPSAVPTADFSLPPILSYERQIKQLKEQHAVDMGKAEAEHDLYVGRGFRAEGGLDGARS